jgi:ubiquinone/menaquinone biosynthesis C-methylase UbiE
MTTANRKSIYRKALRLRDSGKLYDRNDDVSEDYFQGSIDRFCWMADELRDCHKILDIGPGAGLFLSLMYELGHECYAVDVIDYRDRYPWVLREKLADFRMCNAEIEPLPWEDNFFDAVVCSQALEHFTHTHLFAVQEMHRVLKVGGTLELDVPNVACLRNRSRLLRGKNITWDYKEFYLYHEPILQNGMSFYPLRHNREFTIEELTILFKEAGFLYPECYFLKSRRHREGPDRIRSVGSALRDIVPSFRKSLIGFAKKSANSETI